VGRNGWVRSSYLDEEVKKEGGRMTQGEDRKGILMD
jgi:hypothetical protein